MRTKLAPWEKKVGEATGRISVLTAERDVLARRVEDAKKRLDAAVKALAAAQQGSAARDKHIKELEASANKCRCAIEVSKPMCTTRALRPGLDDPHTRCVPVSAQEGDRGAPGRAGEQPG